MKRCILFYPASEEGYWSLGLNEDGSLYAPLACRSLEAVKLLQLDVKTWVILSTARASLFELALPRLSEAKARQAIPYALEEELSQSLDELHFAFDPMFYENGSYLVVTIEKEFLRQAIDFFAENDFQYQLLSLDWFALEAGESCFFETHYLIKASDFKGAMPASFLSLYLERSKDVLRCYLFKDESLTKENKEAESKEDASLNEALSQMDESVLPITHDKIAYIKENEISKVWLAQRLQKTKLLNLCQGEFQKKENAGLKHWFYAALGMSALWLLTLVLTQISSFYSFQKEIAKTDQAIAEVYRQFFPEAKQVISPKFRVSQWLKNTPFSMDLTFWLLLDKLSAVFEEQPVRLERLDFHAKTLSLQVWASNFQALEAFQAALEKTKMQVKPHQVLSQGDKVLGQLELSL